MNGGVRDGARETLKELDKVIGNLNQENIPLPKFSDFKNFSYPANPDTDWTVWGDKIEPAALKSISNSIKKYC